MNNLIKAFILLLLFAIQFNLQAQNHNTTKANVPIKKSTTKSLNQLETEKIKSISVKQNLVQDTIVQLGKTNDSIVKKVVPIDIAQEKIIVKNDTVINKQDIKVIPIIKIAKTDSVKNKNIVIADSNEKIIVVPKEVTTAKVLIDTQVITKQKLPQEDSAFYSRYYKNGKFADSIRNANKHWLDSTLTSLPKRKPVIIHDDDEIEIFVSGGGFYAGVNPKIYDRLTIYNSGLVRHEFKTKLQGEQIEEKKLSKDALKKLAKFIIDMGFFDFNNLYDCNAKDVNCNTRMKSKPEPVPLSVSVAIGTRRNKIYVSFFAPKMESNYVNYPASLEKIVEAIYNSATQ